MVHADSILATSEPVLQERDFAARWETKINIGSGISGAPGWFNIDNSPTVLLSRIPVVRRMSRIPQWPADVRRVDVRKGLPFGGATVGCIYSSHTFEHFTWEESLEVAKECFRILQPGGVMRIVVPDLGALMRDYMQDASPLASHSFLHRLSLSHNIFDLLHPGSHHSQMFDEKSMIHLFREAGFASPAVMAFGQSRIPNIAEVELQSRKSESLYVEALRSTEDAAVG